MLDFEQALAAVPLHVWLAAVAAAILLVFCAASMLRVRPALRVEVLMLGALIGATMTWAFLDRGATDDLRAERRALEARAGELGARTLAPGSPLGCLDALASDSVEAACEKVLFASPASVAAATSYVAARLALLTEVTAYIERGGSDIDHLLLPLRRALETDRFGILAHVLAAGGGCTSDNCGALALLHDAGRVRAHLHEATFNQLLEQYSAAWSQPLDAPVADASQARATAAVQAIPPRKPVNIDFPTAASIPPVSIMLPEPKGPVLPGAAAAAAANPNPQPGASSARHARKHAAVPAPPPAAAAPAPNAPTAAVEPIWPEPVPPPPTVPHAAAPTGEGPLPLNPFPPRPDANAGMSVGAQ
jgi:hypothetical protein